MGKQQVEEKEYSRKKLVVPDMLKVKAGEKFRGVYLKKENIEVLDKKTGELKPVPRLTFQRAPNSEAKFFLLADKGLMTALSWCDVKEGDFIEVEKLEKKDIGGGRTVNQYDVYQLS